jgi:hypothetical protein
VDKAPLKGTSYYRLGQADFDGTSSNSASVSVMFSSYPNEFILFPNPSTGENLNAFITGESGQNFNVIIFDLAGNQVHLSEIILSKDGTSKVVIDLKSKLNRGVFVVKTSTTTDSFTERLLVK